MKVLDLGFRVQSLWCRVIRGFIAMFTGHRGYRRICRSYMRYNPPLPAMKGTIVRFFPRHQEDDCALDPE